MWGELGRMCPPKKREYGKDEWQQSVDPSRSRGETHGTGPASAAGRRLDLRRDVNQSRERDASRAAAEGDARLEVEEYSPEVIKMLSRRLSRRNYGPQTQTQSRGAGSSSQHAGATGGASPWRGHEAAGMQRGERSEGQTGPRHPGGAGSLGSHAAVGGPGSGVRADTTQIWYLYPPGELSEQALALMQVHEQFRVIALGSAHGPVSAGGQATINVGRPEMYGAVPGTGMHPAAGPPGANLIPGPSNNTGVGVPSYIWVTPRQADGTVTYGPAYQPPLPATWRSETGGVWVYQPAGQARQNEAGPPGGSQHPPEIARRNIETAQIASEQHGSRPRLVPDRSSSRFTYLFNSLQQQRRADGVPEERTRLLQWREKQKEK